MSVDEAVKQLSLMKKKGSAIAKDVILEAQRMAIEEHNIEFKSNLWVGTYIKITKYFHRNVLFLFPFVAVAESFATKGFVMKGMRRHGKGRTGKVHYRHSHYYVRLEEGKPPKNYYAQVAKSSEEMLNDWMRMMHNRKVHSSL